MNTTSILSVVEELSSKLKECQEHQRECTNPECSVMNLRAVEGELSEITKGSSSVGFMDWVDIGRKQNANWKSEREESFVNDVSFLVFYNFSEDLSREQNQTPQLTDAPEAREEEPEGNVEKKKRVVQQSGKKEQMKKDEPKKKKWVVRGGGRRRKGKRRRRVILNKYQFPCSVCTAAFHLKGKLNKHMRTKHQGYQCSMCNKKFSQEGYLKVHVSGIHEGIKPFKCEVPGCGQAFMRKNTLRDHDKTHRAERFPCIQCGRIFKQLRIQERHVQTFHNKVKKYKCSICGTNFARRTVRMNHERKCLAMKGPHVCPVPGCGKQCQRKRGLTVHMAKVHKNLNSLDTVA